MKYGTAAEKIHRRVDTATDEELVHRHIKQAGMIGLTLKELESLMGKARNTFSGRITRLLKSELVKDSGERRDGCRVIVDNKMPA